MTTDKFVPLGAAIAGYRVMAGLTQKQFAAKLYVSQRIVSWWECDVFKPSDEKLGEIAQLLGRSPQQLSTTPKQNTRTRQDE